MPSTPSKSSNTCVRVRQWYATTPSDQMSWLPCAATVRPSSNAMTTSGAAYASEQYADTRLRLPTARGAAFSAGTH
jgi:hypothetical protein